tara:strand:- start:719 stop:931 length:213 start_codon:yes stop_codon:yes gene_type:complete
MTAIFVNAQKENDILGTRLLNSFRHILIFHLNETESNDESVKFLDRIEGKLHKLDIFLNIRFAPYSNPIP